MGKSPAFGSTQRRDSQQQKNEYQKGAQIVLVLDGFLYVIISFAHDEMTDHGFIQ